MSRRRWLIAILGVVMILAGIEGGNHVPQSYHWILRLSVLVGTALVQHFALRRMLPTLFRIAMAFVLPNASLWVWRTPALAREPVAWVVLTALFVATLGDWLPARARRNAYGILVAILWVHYLLSLGEATGTGVYVNVLFTGIVGPVALGCLTHYHLRWSTSSAKPEWVRRVLATFPDDDEHPLSGPVRPAGLVHQKL